jgi:uncharacterized metal-binding protein YceD (DUF177 family)
MKDKSFIIKVWDLLQEGGKSDSISFSKKISQHLPHIDKDGISWTVVLNSINQDSLYVLLEDIHCSIEEQCDRCGKIYIRIVDIPKYISRFVANEQRKKEEEGNGDEEIFVINARDETIDLEPMIVQSIVLEEPFVKHCSSCAKEVEQQTDDEDIDEGTIWGGNIIFH